MDTTVNRYQRETTDLQPVLVERDGQPVTTGVEVSVVPRWSRPGEWTAATVVDGRTWVPVTGRTPGLWQVYTRTDGRVLDAGLFEVV